MIHAERPEDLTQVAGPGVRRSLARLILTGMLLCYTAALVYECRHTGLTIDEPSHFAAGYMYWLGSDTLKPSDTPPLTRLVSGWVALVLRAPDPRYVEHYRTRDAYLIGKDILTREDIRARRLLFYTRLCFIPFPILTALVVWRWAYDLFGSYAALIAVLCACLEPSLLGHGALIKSDVPAAFGGIWIFYCCYKHWICPSARTAGLLVMATAIGLLIKFSLLPLFIASLAVLFRKMKYRWLFVAVLPVAVYAAIVCSSQFQVTFGAPQELNQLDKVGLSAFDLGLIRKSMAIPFPLQFTKGIINTALLAGTNAMSGYFLGSKVSGRVLLYFPLSLLLKFPVPLQIMAAIGTISIWKRRASSKHKTALVLIVIAVFVFLGGAMLSNLHIGFRHIVPVLPFLILLAAGSTSPIKRFRLASLPVRALIMWLLVSSLRIYPFGISYFNELAGGPTNGWKYLADSNIDWGQNLPELGQYLQSNKVDQIHLILFTADNYHFYFPETVKVMGVQWPGNSEAAKLRLSPGVYAVSVNVLTGAVLPAGQENYFSEFRNYQPVTRAGYSTLIYKIQ